MYFMCTKTITFYYLHHTNQN